MSENPVNRGVYTKLNLLSGKTLRNEKSLGLGTRLGRIRQLRLIFSMVTIPWAA
jgi:hypothetical protein